MLPVKLVIRPFISHLIMLRQNLKSSVLNRAGLVMAGGEGRKRLLSDRLFIEHDQRARLAILAHNREC